MSYYKIEAADFDGKLTYSTIQQINTKHQTPNIVIFPNPTKDYINIIGNNIKQTIISTIEGKQVITSVSKQIDVSSLAKGIYVITIFTSNGNICNQKLIVQ